MTHFALDRAELGRAIRFLLVGGTTALIYLAVLALLERAMGLDYRIAVSVAYFVAVCFHFAANRRFTFRAHGDPTGGQVARYVVLLAVNYVLMLGVVTFAVEVLRWSPYVAVLLGAAATAGVGFLLARYWVFRGAPHAARQAP